MDDGKVGEFMTDWFGTPRGHWLAWSNRRSADLMGTAKGKRFVPAFRGFDLLSEPQQTLVVLENEDQRIGVESLVGAQHEFRRHLDFQTLYFQFAGHSTIETEFGIYQMRPGDLMLIPEGIAQRSTGTADALRWFFYLREPVAEMFGDDKQLSHTEFEVVRRNGPNWTIPADRREAPKGKVIERMVQWRDPSDDYHTIVERNYEWLIEATSTSREKKLSGVRMVRPFDCFHEITGRAGPGPKPIMTPNFVLEVYNTIGPQRAFHRALRSEEFGIQFAGRGKNLSEFEAELVTVPGDCALIPLGIAHRVVCDPGFMRLVPYSRLPWDVPLDVTKHAYDSTFEVTAKVLKPHDWHREAAAEAAAARAAE